MRYTYLRLPCTVAPGLTTARSVIRVLDVLTLSACGLQSSWVRLTGSSVRSRTPAWRLRAVVAISDHFG
ncbi:hypothetical protein FPL06_18345 [Xanthomonas citri pv. glycines]|nr:hypothetical protein F7R02_13960 [Xanthomonas cissicola]NMI14779.1 hypothetical protein [Xanthomonas citri]QDR44411.1 hypothetical protein FPK90_06650 [Xanthomonas citri pv. glycines]QDS06599.1 hypothetical protein FPL00_06690 [Xanthomonas citri pv. glycines]QDS10881.1 hypothetical protein FPL03_06640 [Xanthomonas citri pv. glycines]